MTANKIMLNHCLKFASAFLALSLPLAACTALATGPSPNGTAGKSEPIPMDQLGAVAGKQYHGDGLSVAATPEGARLRCVFQKLEGQATPEGLWLTSTTDTAQGERFRVVASAVGRESAERSADILVGFVPTPPAVPTRMSALLPSTGQVTVAGQLARFTRPGLTEEYSVSMDGVRQDFIIERPPLNSQPSTLNPRASQLRVELAVTGARAEARADGACLVLDGSGRKIAYSRLRATDATGRELKARIEVADHSAFRTPHSTLAMAVVVEDADAVYPVRIDLTFSDDNWISMGGFPGTLGNVYAAVVDGVGNLYIGGGFTVVGNVLANNVAKWNGSSWSALGSGLNSQVNALAVSGSDLYVGGYFTYATNAEPTAVQVNYIAKWNGSGWSALGLGLNSAVRALAVAGSDLYVGGNFFYATNPGPNAVLVNFIAKWNGGSWSALGSGPGGTVFALAMSGSDLYVGGYFNGGSVAKWNGSSWSALGFGVGGASTFVYALAVSGSDLYAGGGFTTAGGSAANYVAKWNGSSWSALGSGLDNYVYALAVSGSDLYVGGAFSTAGGSPASGVARWDGSSWAALGAALGSGPNSQVNALAVSGSDLYAGGWFTTTGSSAANYVAKWNGTSWSPLGSGVNYAVFALAVSGSDLYAGGAFTTAGGSAANYVAKWNGSSWSALGSGLNNQVRALAVSGSDLYVGGIFTTAGGSAANCVAKWNGSTWSALGSGLEGGYARGVYALAVSGSDLYVGGGFETAGGSPAYLVAKWNGGSWVALGSGLGGHSISYVNALAVSSSDLYVGGNFTTAGGSAANYVAKWNGSSWSALGLGLNDVVYALAVSGSDLYVGGSFTTAGGSAANNVAKWDGSSWAALGSGMNGEVLALAVSGSGLYVGGQFTTAGGKVSAYAARAYLGTPAMAVLGNGTPIANGDTTPSPADYTDFGSAELGSGTVVRTFTITNTGSFHLTLSGSPLVAVSGWQAGDFTITQQPTSPVAAGDSTTFQVTFAPGASGLRSATLSIANDDASNNPYQLAIQGTGTDTMPPAITAQPVSQNAIYGSPLTLSVTALGGALSYQWYFNGSTVSGATASTLARTATSASAGAYTVVVTDLGGSVTSSVAALGVYSLAGVGYAWTNLAGLPGTMGQSDGTGTAARFKNPEDICVDSLGNIFVADYGNSTIRQVTPAGAVTTIAGLALNSGSADGTGSAARFNWPVGVAPDGAGNVYVADMLNHAIRKVTLSGGNWVVTAIAGSAGSAGSADGMGSAARFNAPNGIATDSAGNIYVADYENSTIRKMVFGGGNWTVSTLAGSAGQFGSADGTGSVARFTHPTDVAVDAAGTVYVVDYLNSTIRSITPGGVVTTFAGVAGSTGSTDGTGSAARFNRPAGVGIDAAGNLYVADAFNQTIRKITPGAVVTTLGGSPGVIGTADGIGSAAQFNYPSDLAVDSAGNIYVVDYANHRLTKGTPMAAPAITSQPQGGAFACGSAASVSVSAVGLEPFAYQWYLAGSPVSGATGSSYSFTLGPATVGNYTVIVTNLFGAATSGVAVVSAPAPTIVSQPLSTQVAPPDTAVFNVIASASGCPPLGYQWRFNATDISGATISSLTLPNVTANQAGNYTVVVTNVGGAVTSDIAILTVVTLPAGAQAWVQGYHGPGISDSKGNAVALGPEGNVYVTGYSDGGDSGSDYATIAYSSAGVPLWTNRYNGPGNGQDQANAVAVGTNGNVYVTGSSIGSGYAYYDYATIAYSSAGVPLWTNRYNGLEDGLDQANAVAVGPEGNVYVTGASYFGGTRRDYATIAYSSAGVPLWTNRYHGPGNRFASDDAAAAVAVGPEGNVYVTGSSDGGSSYDYATIAYSSAGVPLWTNRYNGPADYNQANALAVDSGGNVYVTGYSDSGGRSYDYATIAYSSAGVPLWTNRYDGPGHGNDRATAAAVGPEGNVYVTGYSYVGGSSSYDYATIAYSNAGVPLWTNRYDGPGEIYDQANAVAVGSGGIVYVTGSSADIGFEYDYATIAYSSAGVPLWTNRYNGPANGDDIPPTKACLAVGPGNAVYVAGYSMGSGGSYEYALVKYVSAVLPTLMTQPQGGSFACGAAALVSVAVAGSSPLAYQWYFGGSPVPGATSSSYSFTVSQATAGNYTVVVTNRYGLITSAVATVTEGAPTIVSPPQNRTNLAGTVATFSVTSTGTGPLSYQWQRNSVNLSDTGGIVGSSTAKLTLNGVSAGQAGSYTVVVTDACGGSSSATASLVVWNAQAQGLGGSGSDAKAVSDDGTMIVGSLGLWTAASQVWTALSFTPNDISADGSTIVGTDGASAVRWTASGGATTLGLGQANAVSAHGSVVVGDESSVAFRWTAAGGLVSLGVPAGTPYSKATDVSGDGSVVAGDGLNGPSSGVPFRWTQAGGMAGLGGSINATHISADGVFITGHVSGRALRWSQAGGTEYLGYVFPYTYLFPGALSGDGSVIVGWATDFGAHSGAFIWDATHGMRLLASVLQSQGVDLTGWSLNEATAMSTDGRYIVGNGSCNGQPQAWEVTLSSALVPTLPTILTQPQSKTVPVGSSTSFTVAAAGSPPLSYQWRFNNTDIPGATDAALVLSGITAGQVGSYTVVVTGPAGSVTSGQALLSVSNPIFTSVARLPDGNIRLTLSVLPDVTYRIDASTDLVNWAPLASIPAAGNTLQYDDLTAANFPIRFYRAVWGP